MDGQKQGVRVSHGLGDGAPAPASLPCQLLKFGGAAGVTECYVMAGTRPYQSEISPIRPDPMMPIFIVPPLTGSDAQQFMGVPPPVPPGFRLCEDQSGGPR